MRFSDPLGASGQRLMCANIALLLTLFALRSARADVGDNVITYRSKDAVVIKTNEVGCSVIRVPGINQDGTPADFANIFHKTPPNLNPDKLTNAQLETCGLSSRPTDGFRTVDAYKAWSRYVTASIKIPFHIPVVSTSVQKTNYCFGDPTHSCPAPQGNNPPSNVRH